VADINNKTRMQKLYEECIRPSMIEEFGYTNPFAVPKLTKIVINMGVGEATQDKKKVEQAAAEMPRADVRVSRPAHHHCDAAHP